MSAIRFTIQTSWILKPAKIRVTVHDTIKELQIKTDTKHTSGVCQGWYIDNRPLDGQTVAHIHLHREGLGVGLVSHEASHAAMHIYGIKHDDSIDVNDDEDIAYTIGDIVSKIYKQLWKRELIKD